MPGPFSMGVQAYTSHFYTFQKSKVGYRRYGCANLICSIGLICAANAGQISIDIATSG